MKFRVVLASLAATGVFLAGVPGMAHATPHTGVPTHARTAAEKAVTSYVITVKTADLDGAGTDSAVEAQIYGSDGSATGWLYLDDAENNFERNRTDHFIFRVADVGRITKIAITFDHSGRYAAWALEYISVDTVITSGIRGYFPYYNWLTRESGRTDPIVINNQV